MFLHLFKAINHKIFLALSYFWHNFLLPTDEYLPHTVLDYKVVSYFNVIASIVRLTFFGTCADEKFREQNPFSRWPPDGSEKEIVIWTVASEKWF